MSSSQTNVFGGATGRAGWPTVPAAAQHSFVDLQVDRNIVSERDGNGGDQHQGSDDWTLVELPRSSWKRQNGSCDAEAQTARDALPVREAKVLAHCMCGVCYPPKRQDEEYLGGLREKVSERNPPPEFSMSSRTR